MKFKEYLQEAKLEGKEYKNLNDLFDFDNDIQKNDFVWIKNVPDVNNEIHNLKIIYKGLASNWKDINFTIEIYKDNKKTGTIKIKNSNELSKFMKANNINEI